MGERRSRNRTPKDGNDSAGPASQTAALFLRASAWKASLTHIRWILSTILGGLEVFILEMRKLRQRVFKGNRADFQAQICLARKLLFPPERCFLSCVLLNPKHSLGWTRVWDQVREKGLEWLWDSQPLLLVLYLELIRTIFVEENVLCLKKKKFIFYCWHNYRYRCPLSSPPSFPSPPCFAL